MVDTVTSDISVVSVTVEIVYADLENKKCITRCSTFEGYFTACK